MKASLAQPAPYEARWAVTAVLAVVAVLAFASASALGTLLGVLLVAAAGGSVAWIWRESGRAETARARWGRLLYCRRCPYQFTPNEAAYGK